MNDLKDMCWGVAVQADGKVVVGGTRPRTPPGSGPTRIDT